VSVDAPLLIDDLIGLKRALQGCTEKESMKTSLKYFSLWIPFVYAMAIGVIVLSAWSRSTISLPPGFPAAIVFLPMAFLFSALSTQNHISRLEGRIEGLEKQVGRKTSGTSN
jgi:uncharacterized membrane protein YoaK (UPF0700 family)